jgi:NAD(P)-dependent dehydrogenase (short-subunit alcohol dehydrogenase family)
MDMNTHHRFALVTGAGSGIGRAVSLGLHSAGYSIALAGRRTAELKHTIALAPSNSGTMLVVPTDVSQAEQVSALFDWIRQSFGRLDVLFNNAGANAPSIPFDELTYDQWNSVSL